jgi:adenylyltransferase/sulfurtransferase
VREANELEVCKLPDAKNVPLNQLKDRLGEFDKSQAHFLICYGGVRAERAVKTMLEAGFSNARILKGGMKRWVKDVDPDMPIY